MKFLLAYFYVKFLFEKKEKEKTKDKEMGLTRGRQRVLEVGLEIYIWQRCELEMNYHIENNVEI